MPIHFRASLAGVLASLFSIATQPTAGQSTSESIPTEAPSPLVHETESENGLSMEVTVDEGCQHETLSLQWDYVRSLETTKMGLEVAHMRCLASLIRQTIRALDAQVWDSLEVETDVRRISFSGPVGITSKIAKSVALSLINYEVDTSIWSAIQGQLMDEISTNFTLEEFAPVHQLMDVLLFSSNHPYGEVPSPESLQEIELNDLLQFHSTYFRPNNCRISVCVPQEGMVLQTAISELFDDWQERVVPNSSLPRPALTREVRVSWIEDESAEEEPQVQMAHVLRLKDGEEDYWIHQCIALLLEQRIEDAHPQANIEIKFESDVVMGQFSTQLFAPEKRISKIAYDMQQECKRITEEVANIDELNEIKASINIQYTDVCGNHHDVEKFTENEWKERLESVTVNDIRRVAHNIMRPGNMHIAGQGSRESALELAKMLGEGVPIDWYSKSGVFIEPYLPAPEGVTANDIIDSFYAACGGKSAFEAAKTCKISKRMDAEGGTVFNIQTSISFGTGSVSAFEVNGQVMLENVVTDEEGFKRQMGANQSMNSKEFSRLRNEIYAAPLLHLDDLEGDAELLGTLEAEEGTQNVVRITYASGHQQTLFFDAETALLLKSVEEHNSASSVSKITSHYKGYQEFDGLTFPANTIQTTNGREIQFIVESMKFDVRIDPKIFNRY
jgi:hypothetical protein